MTQDALEPREHFPVASLLLPGRLRRQIRDFYRFARGADDIADDATRPAEERRAELEALDAALHEGNEAALPAFALPYFRLVQRGHCNLQYGRNLLRAFRLDTLKDRYDTLDELVHYCAISAAPVGRTVLELAGEHKADLWAADQLCNAWQLLNHLCDCKEDYEQLNRCYLPQKWLEVEKASLAMLKEDATKLALRKVFDRLLREVEDMLAIAARLPASIKGKRLRIQARATWHLADALMHRLRDEDPLAGNIKLSKGDYLRCAFKALFPLQAMREN